MEKRFPLPPFTLETALQKIQLAEDAWNSQDPEKVSKAYTVDTEWRNRSQFVNGREEVVSFLTEKWQKEKNYKLIDCQVYTQHLERLGAKEISREEFLQYLNC